MHSWEPRAARHRAAAQVVVPNPDAQRQVVVPNPDAQRQVVLPNPSAD